MFSHFLRKLTVPTQAGEVVRRDDGPICWYLSASGLQLFGDSAPNLKEWNALGLGDTVKVNLQRTIRRIKLPQATLYLKICRVNTPRSLAREILRPPKARLEFENAVRLQALDIPTTEPLAWGHRRGWLPTESYLLTREVAHGVPVADYLSVFHSAGMASHFPRQQVARDLATFLAKLHDAGVTHPDPHPGNMLIIPGRPEPSFVLMDLHALQFGPPLTELHTLENLILVNRWFQMRASRTDRLRFWRQYWSCRQSLTPSQADLKSLAQNIEQATHCSNRRFWAARMKRYQLKNRDSYPVRGEQLQGYAAAELPETLRDQLLAAPDQPFADASGKLLKNSRTSTVMILEQSTATGSKRYLWKRFNVKSWVLPFKNAVRPSPALRSWLAGNSVLDRGMATAKPLLFLERRDYGLPSTGYVLFEWIAEAEELPTALENLRSSPEQFAIVRHWVSQLARLIRQLHDRDVSHRDLKGANILMRGSDPWKAEPILIDLVGVELNRAVPDAIRQRDLARLAASFLTTPSINQAMKLRFLRVYFACFPRRAGDWKSWWKAIRQIVEQKIRRNQLLGRPLN